MGHRKIVDENEVVRWFEEGRTYAWMQAEYERKYNIETVPSTWSSFRHREGLDRRIERTADLVPWSVTKEHRWAYPLMMLRAEERRRAGHANAPTTEQRLDRWLATLRAGDQVVAYDSSSSEGFALVPRRPGIDTDLVREPDQEDTPRRAGD